MMPSRKLACILGFPVAHSLSPRIHTAAFAACGLAWNYVPIAVRPGAIEEGMGLVRALGIDGGNVTMPHKQAIIPFLDGLAPEAQGLGAVNTIVRAGDALVGHNTDGAGFVAFLRADAGFDPGGKRALVLGGGGAARAIAVALTEAGAQVTVSARRIQQASEIASFAGVAVLTWGERTDAELVVNATPSRDEVLPDRPAFGSGVLAVDLIYQPPITPFVRTARAAGARAYDGLGMLIHQAALSFRLWTGLDAPVEVMRAAAGVRP